MVTNLTLDNVESVKFASKVVAIESDKHLYILAIGQKNSTMFVPLTHGADYRYKCKTAKATVKAALLNGETVMVCDNHKDLFRHCL